MTTKLADKVALVTGGHSGIGPATAKRFVAEGAHVFITGRRHAQLDAAAQEIGGGVIGAPATSIRTRRPSACSPRTRRRCGRSSGRGRSICATAGSASTS